MSPVTTPRIVTLTLNPALDLAVEVDAVKPEDKLRATSPAYDPGGGGINVARVIQRLGGDAMAIYPFGGESGRMLNERLTSEGVTINSVPTENPTRQNFSVFERSTNKQFRFVLPGSRLNELELRAVLDRLDYSLPGSDYLVASGSLPPDIPAGLYADIARLAKRRNVKFILDTSGEPLRLALEQGVFAFKPNGKEFEELARLMGLEPSAAHDETLERKLVEDGTVQALLLTLGARGGVLRTKKERMFRKPPSLNAASAVGAGDSFLGGFVVGLTRGYDMSKAFLHGMAAAAATMLSPGTELCTAADTERFFGELQSS